MDKTQIRVITDELLEVVVSLRFAPSYKREGIREFIHIQLWSVNQQTTEAEEVTDS
jgi:hypothetical protein